MTEGEIKLVNKDDNRVGYLIYAALIIAINTLERLADYKSINGDNALYLQTGDLILSGWIPYVDFLDTNPPLIMYINVLPALLSRVTGLALTDSFQIIVLAFVTLSMGATYFVINRYAPVKERWILGPVMLSYALLCVASMTDYGQREFLFILFFLPFFFLRWERWEGTKPPPKFAMSIGLLAGLGLCLKQYFFIPFIAMELYWIYKKPEREPLIAPEMQGVAIFTLLYVLHFLLLPDASKNGFFNFVVPFLMQSFDAFNAGGLVFAEPTWLLRSCLTVIALLSAASLAKRTTIAWPLFVLTLTFVILVLVQGKNWSYYGIPMVASSILLILLPMTQVKGIAGKSWSATVIGVIATIYAAAQVAWMSNVVSFIPFEWEPTILSVRKNNEQVLYLDVSSWPWYSFSAHYNIKPASRYLWLFPITMFEFEKQRSDPEKQKVIDEKLNIVIANLAADIWKFHPELIVCRTTGCYKLPEDFNLLEYLSSRGLEKSLRNYKQFARTDHFVYFTRLPDAKDIDPGFSPPLPKPNASGP